MKKEKYHVKSRLFFIEMLLSLLFFSVSGAVIINVFAGANQKVRDGELTNNIAVCAQSCAEAYSVSGDSREMAETVFGSGEYENGEFNITLNNRCEPDSLGSINLSVIELKDYYDCGAIGTVSLVFSRQGVELYSLLFRSYIPKITEGGLVSNAQQP